MCKKYSSKYFLIALDDNVVGRTYPKQYYFGLQAYKGAYNSTLHIEISLVIIRLRVSFGKQF